MTRPHSVRLAIAAVAVSVSVAGCASVVPPPTDHGLETGPGSRVALTSAAPATTASRSSTPPLRATVARSSATPAVARRSTSTRPAAPSRTMAGVLRRSGSVFAVGDSLLLDVQPSLLGLVPGVRIDAAVGRQPGTGLDVLRAQREHADVTVFALGTNGPLSPDQLQAAIDLTRGRWLVIVTSHCGYCAWTDTNNATVRRLCTHAQHCTVADFEALASRHPEWFTSDGVHMAVGGAGAQGYARLVAAAVRG